jgi:hypothetical protein
VTRSTGLADYSARAAIKVNLCGVGLFGATEYAHNGDAVACVVNPIEHSVGAAPGDVTVVQRWP